jgi:hypothetical protein
MRRAGDRWSADVHGPGGGHVRRRRRAVGRRRCGGRRPRPPDVRRGRPVDVPQVRGVPDPPHQRRSYHRRTLSCSRARDQDVYDATSQVAGLHGDPCAAGGEAADAEAEAEAWRQAYTCTELLSTLIPSTPFPLMPVSRRCIMSLVRGHRCIM